MKARSYSSHHMSNSVLASKLRVLPYMERRLVVMLLLLLLLLGMMC